MSNHKTLKTVEETDSICGRRLINIEIPLLVGWLLHGSVWHGDTAYHNGMKWYEILYILLQLAYFVPLITVSFNDAYASISMFYRNLNGPDYRKTIGNQSGHCEKNISNLLCKKLSQDSNLKIICLHLVTIRSRNSILSLGGNNSRVGKSRMARPNALKQI